MGSLRTCILLLFVILARSASAQEADTTAAPPRDSLIVSDSLAIQDSASTRDALQDSIRLARALLPPIPFLDEFIGTATGDTLPVRHMSLDPQGMLGEVQGSFVYDFGASGWPDGWAPFGLSPNDPSLSFNNIPFSEPSSGLPSYDLLPFTLLQHLKLQPGHYGSVIGVNTRLRSFDSSRPLTEISYRSSSNGLQSVLVSHSQQRRLQLAGRPGQIHFLLAYGGHGANGEYAGSRLEGARQLVARIRLKNSLGSLEVLNLNNRRRIGAHAGVIPGSNYINIYNRFSAQVTNPSAQRQKLRNDLSVTLRTPVLPDINHPLTASGYWTANTFRYVNGDTLQARTHTLGYVISQEVALSWGSLSLNLEGSRQRVREDSRDTTSTASALPDSIGIQRKYVLAYALLEVQTGNLGITVTPGYYNTPHGSLVGGALEADYTLGGLRLFVSSSRALSTIPLIAEYGWGPGALPLPQISSAETVLLRGGISLQWKALDATLSAFTHESTNAFDYLMNATRDTLQTISFSGPVSWRGFSAEFGFRRAAARGFYVTASSTHFQFNSPTSLSHFASISQSLPDVFIQGRTGLRYRIFKGDLDFDLYTQGRLWSSFLGRTLHPQTGLLVLRDAQSRQIESSAAIDVMLEAKVRAATFFLGFENLLSGTNFIVGNLLVPDYPLPQRRFRFGVFWPIWN